MALNGTHQSVRGGKRCCFAWSTPCTQLAESWQVGTCQWLAIVSLQSWSMNIGGSQFAAKFVPTKLEGSFGQHPFMASCVKPLGNACSLWHAPDRVLSSNFVALWLSPLSRITCLIANFQLMRGQSSDCINNCARSLLYPSTIPLNPNCLLLWLDYSICLVQWPCWINNFDSVYFHYIPAFKFLSMNFMSCPTERIRKACLTADFRSHRLRRHKCSTRSLGRRKGGSTGYGEKLVMI